MPFNVVDLAGAERTPRSPQAPRVLIYSHDTFGLGHIRRCRAIANSLVATYPHISVIIVSGSSVISSFQFGDGVDYVRIPGVEKQSDGRYGPHHLNLDLHDTIRLRTDIIKQVVLSFDPDVVIVDKEPIGLRGELVPALDILRRRGARIVLGLRDVLDEPAKLHEEWRQSGALEALGQIYDDIFVYGLESIYQPLAGLPNQHLFAHKIRYTGYLKRAVPSPMPPTRYPRITKGPFILVTPGGGGDGAGVIDWVISAYEADPTIELPALIVFGPFMSRERRKDFAERIARIPKLESLGFEPRLELLMNRAHCVVAMGGYNTFCEVLSFDKPALIVPRVKPRLEQAIRAERADHLKLVDVLHDPQENGEGERDPLVMARALHGLPRRMPPSQAFVPSLLDGLPAISRALAPDLSLPMRSRAAVKTTAATS
ncbi:glycosyltransferase family protein [Bosea sp. (in: a-proteobacteria)]|jgi:predicted glycosyltransferase|uniref:glycosyltransferase family protein n=1 Tax=Bosea sp. (in: a-proteobacteria) TaxID=1871050 RepID=UPI00083D6D57|nr:glycosyltransferase [Bosea sp. (in: a-proteobacteria)]WRH56425.1 MAG: glycosyltransferase [Bosea sp. (in: a-proteobacteria)]